jgi:hypothetical protein
MVWLDPGPGLLGEAPQPALAAKARPQQGPQGGLEPVRWLAWPCEPVRREVVLA